LYMPALIVELVDLVAPENIGNYLAVNVVHVPVQTSERDRDRTYKFDLGAMYRNIIDYVDSLHNTNDGCQCKCNNCCNYDDCESKRNIEDCDIEIYELELRNVEDCDINI